MFARRFFSARMFAPRYFPPVAGDAPEPEPQPEAASMLAARQQAMRLLREDEEIIVL